MRSSAFRGFTHLSAPTQAWIRDSEETYVCQTSPQMRLVQGEHRELLRASKMQGQEEHIFKAGQKARRKNLNLNTVPEFKCNTWAKVEEASMRYLTPLPHHMVVFIGIPSMAAEPWGAGRRGSSLPLLHKVPPVCRILKSSFSLLSVILTAMTTI